MVLGMCLFFCENFNLLPLLRIGQVPLLFFNYLMKSVFF